jgi:hypothetical protein
MKKNNPLIIVLFWILWGIGLNYVSEYVISRPISGILQFGVILVVLGFTALLIKKTHDCIINLLKN